MKEVVWRALVFFVSLLPRKLMILICRLLFEGFKRGESRAACMVLLQLEDVLKWHINDTAVSYEGGIHPKHRLTRYHDYFSTRLSKGEKVLDVGCGYGALANTLSEVGAVVLGVDRNEEKIEIAKHRFNNSLLTFVHGDINDVILPEGLHIKTIVMSNVLEHIENREKLLIELNEKFNPERFLIRVPMLNRSWDVYFRKELGIFYYSDPTHFTEYTVKTFFDEIEGAGLKVKEYEIMWGEIYAEVV